MTQPPPPPPSPFGDDTDEALGALLDGELGAFADDHGLTEAEARDRLEQWSEYAARLAALEQGRAAVGEPVPPLDDLTRRQLVRNALPAADGIGASSTRSGWSWLRISAAAAAALVVLAGLGAMLTSLGTGNDDSAKSSTAGSAATAAVPSGDLGNLGDVSNPAAIRALVDPAAHQKPTPKTGGADAQRKLSGDSSTSGGPAEDSTGSLSIAPRSDTLVDPKACAGQLAGARPVRFFATGTYQGQPVAIVGIESGGRTIAFVVPSNDCTNVLTAISR
jgi:hypothetical protein